jgi:hypothetical protein
MTDSDIQFLNDNRTHYDTLVNAGYMRGLSGETRQRMQNIIRAEWEPGYHTDLWCPPCISDMVKKLYRLYDEWLAKEAVKVNASYPSNKTE